MSVGSFTSPEPRDPLAELAAKINAEHEAGIESNRKGLDHYRTCGKYLIEVRAELKRKKRRDWLKWLKRNCPGLSKTQAYRYIEWADFPVTGTFEQQEEAWRKISGNAKDDDAGAEHAAEGENTEATTDGEQQTTKKSAAKKTSKKRELPADDPPAKPTYDVCLTFDSEEELKAFEAKCNYLIEHVVHVETDDKLIRALIEKAYAAAESQRNAA